MRTNIYKELDIFHAGSTYDLGSSLLELRDLGPFEALASSVLKKWQDRGLHEARQSSVRLSYFADLAVPVFFSAQLYQRQDSDDAESHESGHMPDVKSAALVNEPTEQTSTKLLCHMQSVIAHSDYEDPHPLTGPTLRLVLRILKDENVGYPLRILTGIAQLRHSRTNFLPKPWISGPLFKSWSAHRQTGDSSPAHPTPNPLNINRPTEQDHPVFWKASLNVPFR